MAVPLIELQTIRDTILRAMGNPALRARKPDGSEVQYRTIDEANTALGIIDVEIRKAGGASTASVSLAQHSRGDGRQGPSGRWVR